MKKCTQCAQVLSDDTKFCFKCGAGNFEPVVESGGTYQQPTYQQPTQQAPQQPSQQSYYAQPTPPAAPTYQQQPAYQPPPAPYGDNGNVSIGMNLLFLILSAIPLVNIIYAIVIAASSKKKSYKNLAIAWFIFLAIGIVLTILFSALIYDMALNIIDSYGYNFSY